jgi:hypothetical protein
MYLESGTKFVPALEANDALAVCWADGVGLAVQVLLDAPAETVLDRFAGMVCPEVSQHSLQVCPGLHISATRFIGFLSHGCAPNCRLDMDRFELVTLRPVTAGELLTIDYAATEDVLHAQFACHCGADGCRKWITGRNDPVSGAGKAYLAADHAAMALRLQRA